MSSLLDEQISLLEAKVDEEIRARTDLESSFRILAKDMAMIKASATFSSTFAHAHVDDLDAHPVGASDETQ